MSIFNLAFLYVMRKKGKSLTFFLLLLLITVSVMAGFSILSGTKEAAKHLRETIGASFTLSGKISDVEFHENNSEFYTNLIPVTSQAVTQILEVGGIKAYNAEECHFFYAENFEYLSGMPNGKISANTETDYQSDFVEGTLALEDGRHLTGNDRNAGIVSKQLASINNLSIGDSILIKSCLDGETKSTGIEIIGIYSSDEKMDYDNDTIFTDHDTFSELTAQELSVFTGNVTFYVADPEDLDGITSQVKQINSIPWEDYLLKKNESDYQEISYQLRTLERLTEIMISAVIVVGVTIMVLVLTMRIKNRIRETGILLSIGTTAAGITMQFICETLMIAIPAFIVAVPLGILLAEQVETVLRSMGNIFTVTVSFKKAVIQFFLETVAIVLIVIASSLPSARLKPQDILSKMN